MRSLMASNPFFTARDSLLALFDENRKKVSWLITEMINEEDKLKFKIVKNTFRKKKNPQK